VRRAARAYQSAIAHWPRVGAFAVLVINAARDDRHTIDEVTESFGTSA
jgi:hypothetical protein